MLQLLISGLTDGEEGLCHIAPLSGGNGEGAECAEDSAGSESSDQLIIQRYSLATPLSKGAARKWRFAFAHGGDYA